MYLIKVAILFLSSSVFPGSRIFAYSKFSIDRHFVNFQSILYFDLQCSHVYHRNTQSQWETSFLSLIKLCHFRTF